MFRESLIIFTMISAFSHHNSLGFSDYCKKCEGFTKTDPAKSEEKYETYWMKCACGNLGESVVEVKLGK